METLFTVILVVTSLVMIVAILLQSGKGSGLAAGFGGASAGTKVFGGSGAGGFLLKVTVVLGAVFMISSMALSYIASQPKSALSGIQSTATGASSTASQAETIVTRGSGPAPEVEPEPTPAPDLNIAPGADSAPVEVDEAPAADSQAPADAESAQPDTE